jgi:hypothetical protein
LVEQLTLNQRVQGSNPCAPTINQGLTTRAKIFGSFLAHDASASARLDARILAAKTLDAVHGSEEVEGVMSDLLFKLHRSVVLMKDKEGRGTTAEDAQTLAAYARLLPGTNGFSSFVQAATA